MEENKNKILNVPTLRFGGFSDLWKKSTIEKNAKVYDGTHQTPIYTKSGVKFVSVENINDLYSSGKYISVDDYNSDFKYVPEINDILMTRIGDIGTPALVTKSEPLAYYVSLALLKEIDLEPHFLCHYIQTAPFQKELWRRTLHVAFPKKINKNEIGDCAIFYPSTRCEQKKIALFLDGIEKRIKIQNKIISKYETLIKGISNHLLCKIEDCPTIKLSDILIEYNDKARQNNEYPILSSTMNGIFVQSEYFNKQAASEETVGYKKVPYGYCTYRSMSDTGEFRFNIQKIVEIGIVSPAYPVFTSVEYDMRFIAFYLNNSARLRKQILEIKEGGTRFALPFSKLRSLTIPKITRLQQTKIVDVYCLFSRKKELEQRFLLKLKEQKDYLLSKMFI